MALRLLLKAEGFTIDTASGEEGLNVLEQISRMCVAAPVIVMTA